MLDSLRPGRAADGLTGDELKMRTTFTLSVQAFSFKN